MDLTRLQVETLLNVSSTDLDKFIQDDALPCYQLGNEKRFDLLEIESWLLKHHFWEKGALKLPYNLYRALARGGFYYVDDLEDASILRWGSQLIAEKLDADPEGIFELLSARELLASTGMGDGFAIPHPRERLDTFKQDILVIIHLGKPIEFNALDQKEVHTFFFLFAGSDKSHLNLLSKLAHLIHSKQAEQVITGSSSQTSILESLLEWEQKLSQSNLCD